jgi:hypothetical protein
LTTNEFGQYSFVGLAPGTDTVCVALQAGWSQIMPTMGTDCGGTMGYTFTLAEFGGASFVNFGNVVTP